MTRSTKAGRHGNFRFVKMYPTTRVASTRIPSKGPFTLPLPDGGRIEVWYTQSCRMWCIQQRDERGYQVGPGFDRTAEYEHHREDAVTRAKQLLAAATDSVASDPRVKKLVALAKAQSFHAKDCVQASASYASARRFPFSAASCTCGLDEAIDALDT